MPTTDKPTKPARKGKVKNFARINSVKMCKVSDGKQAHTCSNCGTNHRFKSCPYCGR